MKSITYFLQALVLPTLFAFFSVEMFGTVAVPHPIEVTQPDGETITIRLHGDEFFHYATDEAGYVIAKNSNGFYNYAIISDEGTLEAGPVKVSKASLRNSQNNFIKAGSAEFTEKIKKPAIYQRLGQELKQAKSGYSLRASEPLISGKSESLAQTAKIVVILVNFADKNFAVQNPQQAYASMLNQAGYSSNGGTGSVKDFYTDNSNGLFSPEFDVFGPITLPRSIAYYAKDDDTNSENAKQMVVDACQLASAQYPTLNFANYDRDKDGTVGNIMIIYAGHNKAEGANYTTIWPHASSISKKNIKINNVLLDTYACTSELCGYSGTEMAGIGTFVHEFGHTLGLPDLYDADKEVNGQGPGIESWCTMGSGNYLNNGRTPPYFGAAERYIMGWINPVILTSSKTGQSLTISSIASNTAYRINTPTPNDFFFLETRKKTGWDRYLPGEGMLVFHIDMSITRDKVVKIDEETYTVSALELWASKMPNIIGEHQCMDMLRANNNKQIYTGNPFPGSGNITSITDNTNPGLLSWNKEKSYTELTGIKRNIEDGSITFKLAKSANAPDEKTVQLPFAEEFKKGIPNTWTIIDNNKDGKSWYSASLTTSDDEVIGVAAIKGNNNLADDWLISPQLAIPTGLGRINFNFNAAITSNQAIDLMLSQSTSEIASFSKLTSVNLSYDGTPGSGDIDGFYSLVTPFNLSSYGGKSVYLAFVNKTLKGGALYLTNITVKSQYTTGIDEKESSLPLVYAQNRSIYFTNISSNYEASIYDISGRLTEQLSASGNHVFTAGNPGIYIVKVKVDQQTYTYKLILR